MWGKFGLINKFLCVIGEEIYDLIQWYDQHDKQLNTMLNMIVVFKIFK